MPEWILMYMTCCVVVINPFVCISADPDMDDMVEKSTIDSVRELLNGGYWAPGLLILIFSISLPAIKLALLIFGELRGHLVRVRRAEHIDIRRVLRLASKFQMVDVFIGTIRVFHFGRGR